MPESFKDRAKNSIKSGAAAVWNKIKSKRANKKTEAFIKTLVAASVAGGLALGTIGYVRANDAQKTIRDNNSAWLQDLHDTQLASQNAAAQAADAQTAANQAQAKAVDAQSKADQAQSIADKAKADAVTAASKADAAQATANSVADKASAAQATADQAKTAAADAKAAADQATADLAILQASGQATQDQLDAAEAKLATTQAAASNAQAAADAAQATADAAQAGAGAAQTTADKATADAAAAQTTADNAQTTANQALSAAQAAQTAANAAQATANEALAKANQALAAAQAAQATANEALAKQGIPGPKGDPGNNSVTTYFPTTTYSDFGNGGLHCYGQPAAGSIIIPPGTYTVSAGGISGPYPGTMLVQFSDGQKMFENANNYSCGQFSEEGSPIFNSKTVTFTSPVTATLYFELDTGSASPIPITNPFITYTVS